MNSKEFLMVKIANNVTKWWIFISGKKNILGTSIARDFKKPWWAEVHVRGSWQPSMVQSRPAMHWSHLRPCYWNVRYIAWPWEANARCLKGSETTRPDSATGNSKRGRVARAPFRRFYFLTCWYLERFNIVSPVVFFPASANLAHEWNGQMTFLAHAR